MRREEKRKRFHEAVLKTLYPPPSSPESEKEDENKQVIISERAINLELENPEYFGEHSSSKSDDGIQTETMKLSRAQRKRLRKKKLEEDAFRHGKMIGPLLPSSEAEHGGVGSLQTKSESESQGVRENAVNEQVASSEKPGYQEQEGGSRPSSKKKVKQRRIAKRLAKEGSKSTETENSVRDT